LFSPVELANLTLVIGLINLWNRVVIGGGFHLAKQAA
jgi:alkylhydroperoxidase family enzyme